MIPNLVKSTNFLALKHFILLRSISTSVFKLVLRTLLIVAVIIYRGVALSQDIVVNEVLLTPSVKFPKPWIEFKNTGFQALNLNKYRISISDSFDQSVTLPNLLIEANGYITIYLFTEEEELTEDSAISFNVELYQNQIHLFTNEGVLVDSVPLVYPLESGESFGRFPENSKSFVFFPEVKVSPGTKNPYPGPWIKLTNNTKFSPRDSSPNACVIYDNKFWIFEGWEYKDGVFASQSNVWVSEDMVNWEPVNDNPPYNAYSAYIAYKGKMWAFDDKCWSSTDGVNWVEESDYFPGSLVSRVTVLRDTLWFAKAKSIGYSVNGINWHFKLLGTAPWSSRDWPAFKAFNNKLWYFGGGNVYSPTDHYYYNDVWVSDDGESWDLVTGSAPWPGRFWFSYEVFDDKLWLFGGYDVNRQDIEYGNLNDVWFTENGIDWHEFKSDNIWLNRHAQITIATDTSIYISSGYSSGGVSRLHNDVWKLSLKEPQYFDVRDFSIVYGETKQLSDWLGNSDYSATLQDNSVIEIHSNTIEAVRVGQASVKVSLPSSEQHYQNDTIINLEVLKKDMIVEIDDYFKSFAEDNPDFKIKLTGFINTDNLDSLEELPVIYTEASKYSSAGTYLITAIGGTDNNYNFVVKEGYITVLKGNGPIVFPNPSNNYIYIFPDNCMDERNPDAFYTLQILTSTGQEVKRLLINCSNQEPIFLGELPEAIYIAKIVSGGEIYFKKFIIER